MLFTDKINPKGLLIFFIMDVELGQKKNQTIYNRRKPMKSIRFLLIITIMIAALGFYPAPAYAGAFTYTSGIQVQNLEGTEASIAITFYNPDGSVEATVPDTIPANGSKTFFPLPMVEEGFSGSAVISSNTQVAAITNVVGNDFAAAASYIAASAGHDTLLIPLLMKENSGFNTWFNVQNTGTATAAVTVTYSTGVVSSANIPAGSAYTFDQALEAHTQQVFSAIVTSDQPIAAAVIEESSQIMFAYSGFGNGSTNPVLPLINANNSGYVTGVQIQNAGSVDTTVTLSYTPAVAGTACTETQMIPAGSDKTFALGAFAGSPPPGATTDCVGGARFVGSAKVTGNTANQDLTAIVNQLLPGTNGEAYNGFNIAEATAKVVMPLIMDRNSGWFTGFNVMNVGTAATTVSCTFTGTTYSVSATLQPGEALNDIQNNKIAPGYVGSGTCTAGAGGMIVAVVNELGGNSAADQLLVYEGVPGP
jgi:hypothetical protein